MRVSVRVVPRAKHFKIESCGDNLKVYITDPAVEGRANKKLIEVLADYFKVRKYNIRIVKGERHREKIVEIDGCKRKLLPNNRDIP
jgi:uncharacterized protein (TIGR00251 family)